jgi:hypothetical protein
LVLRFNGVDLLLEDRPLALTLLLAEPDAKAKSER